MKKITLSERADMVIKANPGLTALKPVIEKELINIKARDLWDIVWLQQQSTVGGCPAITEAKPQKQAHQNQ